MLSERREALDDAADDNLLTVDEVAADLGLTSTSTVPRSPSKLRILPEASDDVEEIQQADSEAATRIVKTIDDWKDQIQWSRVPQEHLTYLSGSSSYSFYRQRVGNGITGIANNC